MELHELFLVPEVPDETEIQEGVDGLAWEHATLFAKLSDIELGSEEFVEVHKSLLERYRELGDHLGFIQHSAMRLLQALLMTNLMALVVTRGETSETVCDKLQHLGHIITSALMYVHASHPQQWIPNNEWGYLDEEQRGIDFPITIPTEGEGNDDHR